MVGVGSFITQKPDLPKLWGGRRKSGASRGAPPITRLLEHLGLKSDEKKLDYHSLLSESDRSGLLVKLF